MPDKKNNNQADHLVYTFGEFSMDTTRGVLCRGDDVVPLRPQAWSLLLHLLEHRGELVSRSDLIETVWNNASVTDDSITQCVVEVRRALGDAEHTMIRTVPRRGFVFEVSVEERLEGVEQAAPAITTSPGARPSLWLAAAVLIAVAVGLWILNKYGTHPGSSPNEETASIAVLAFTDMTAAGDRGYFGDGIAEEILNHLAQIPELRVISRSSSFLYRDDPDIPVIAEELGVDFVLEGSVRGSDEDLRITVQLINAHTNAHVWAESFDRETSLDNLIAVQNDIAASVASAIGVETGAILSPPPREDPEIDAAAMDSYLQGVFLLRTIQTVGGGEGVFGMALDQLNVAIDVEPEWALPYAAKGSVLHFLATSGYTTAERIGPTFEESRANLLEAIRLDPDYGPAYGSLAFVAHAYDFDFEEAERLYARAESLGHRRHWGQALMFRTQGRYEEAVEHYRQAALDDPLSTGVTWQLADALRCLGRYEESARELDGLLEQAPNNLGHLAFRAWLSVRMGDEAGARQILDEHDIEGWPALFGESRALLGMYDEAEAALDQIESYDQWNLGSHTRIAVAVGQHDRALDYLEELAGENPAALGISQCPDDIGSLGENPRFKALLESVGIPVTVGSGAN